MTNEYAPKPFLRQASMNLLKEYFARRDELKDVPWDQVKETEVEPVRDAWQALPEQARARVEYDFHRISDIASTNGTRILVEEGQSQGIDLKANLENQDGHINKALWVFLHHPEVFERACLWDLASHLNGKYWRKRKDLPKDSNPDTSPKALKELGDSISAYYRENQGRGRHCHAEHYLRAGQYHYFFVYPQDYTDTFIGYKETGEFDRRPHSPAFEVILIYAPQAGALELFVHGDKKIVRDLQQLFARAILHEELGEERRDAVPYKLGPLARKDFSFPTDPADRVKDVKVKSLRLSLVGNHRKKITFDTDAKDAKGNIYEFMEMALHEKRLPLSMVNVNSAVIQMIFENTNGNGRPTKTLSFRISAPDSCNLKDSPEELVAKKYLKEWKIEQP